MTNPTLRTPEEVPFSIEEIARLPLPGMIAPGAITFSPDNRWITFLFSADRSMTRQLFAYDPTSGEQQLLVSPPEGGVTDANVSLEEALRRERQRKREFGVTDYAWAKCANRLLVPLREDIYLQDGVGEPLRLVYASQNGPLLDAQISPDGNWVAFVQDAELYVVPAEGGEPRQLTRGARETGKTHGLAEYVAQEEMDRSHGFWWSPDSRWIAFEEVDETHIPVYRIVHQGKDFTGQGAQEDHHYPFAGQENARVHLGIVPLQGGEPVWVNLEEQQHDFYLARVDWMPDGRLCAQIENRQQTELDLIIFHPPGERGECLLRENSPVWINLHNLFRPLGTTDPDLSGGFIWASERSGYLHLYLYDRQGKLVRQLTRGEWVVDDLVGVDEVSRMVYFTGSKDGPLESHLYAVSYAGDEPHRLTSEAGTHAVVCDRQCSRFVDLYSSLDTPPQVSLKSLQDGSLIRRIYVNDDPRRSEFDLHPPELVSLLNREGVRLYGALYKPVNDSTRGPSATIVYVYGGPHAQIVKNNWLLTVNMRAQYLRALGFLVFMLDNRGSARRGLQFEAVIKHHMGDAEVQDQVDGVHWLVERRLADPERIGIYGWSYGGYMAVMCLARAPETFKVAVAGAPVTAWDGYDTHYTERYMGTPQSNPQGYKQSSVLAHVDHLRGKLMLVHGMIDENVHFRHTARLIKALIQARKPYDLLLFPDERHSPRKLEDRVYMESLINQYFVQNLS